MAGGAGLQPGCGQGGGVVGRQGWRRSAAGGGGVREGARCRIHVRLRAALGAAALPRLGRLRAALERYLRMGWRPQMIEVKQPPDPWQRTTTEHGFAADEVISAL